MNVDVYIQQLVWALAYAAAVSAGSNNVTYNKTPAQVADQALADFKAKFGA